MTGANYPDLDEMDDLDGYNAGTNLYVVFVQHRSGDEHRLEGEIWAPNERLALFYAKEQFARRGRCRSIWVVRADAIVESSEQWVSAFERDATKRWRHASFFSAGKQHTPDLVSRLIKEEEG